MATVWEPPKGYEAPSIEAQMRLDFKGRPSEYDQAHDAYVRRLADYARSSSGVGHDPVIGEIVRFPMGDGYAEYLVWRAKPLQLVHVAWGDCWQAHVSTIRGLRLADVRSQIEADQRMNALFSRHKKVI